MVRGGGGQEVSCGVNAEVKCQGLVSGVYGGGRITNLDEA